jgi:hypothetical protein
MDSSLYYVKSRLVGEAVSDLTVKNIEITSLAGSAGLIVVVRSTYSLTSSLLAIVLIISIYLF